MKNSLAPVEDILYLARILYSPLRNVDWGEHGLYSALRSGETPVLTPSVEEVQAVEWVEWGDMHELHCLERYLRYSLIQYQKLDYNCFNLRSCCHSVGRTWPGLRR